jgi:UDP-N-acetylmuramyl tripeptide synthase
MIYVKLISNLNFGVIYVITIGVIGSRGKSAVAEIIQGELEKQGKAVCYTGINMDISDNLCKCIYDNIDYSIIAISRETILNKRLERIKFDVLIQTALEEESNELILEMQNTIYTLKENGYFIFNSDSIQKIDFKCASVFPVTYGLNGKTTITTSSIDDTEKLCFSYCLQRSILSLSGKVIQPFEVPIIADGEYDDINYYLAAYTCLLVLGNKF